MERWVGSMLCVVLLLVVGLVGGLKEQQQRLQHLVEDLPPHIAARTPVISSTFHAKVSVVMREGPVQGYAWWKGGGIFAVDMEKGIARTDIHLEGQQGQKPIHFHTLDRYDLQSTYTIDDLTHKWEEKCKRNKVMGKPENPFAWVDHSEYRGRSSYLGFTLENWEYFENNTGTRMKISIKKGTSIPMFFSTRHVSNASVSEWDMTFMEWHEENMPKWMVYIPQACKFTETNGAPANLGDNSGVVYFANKNWDCADVSCSQTVPAGTGQPGYACAEFVARSLCNGGYIPNIGPYDPQSSYLSYSYNGASYDLCYTTYLSNALGALGFAQEAASASSVSAGCAAFGDGGDGYFSHVVIGVGSGICDAHNNARYQVQVSWDLYQGVNAVWCPAGSSSSGTSSGSGPSSSSGSSSSYTSGTDPSEMRMDLGVTSGANLNVIYDIQNTPSKERISANIQTDSTPEMQQKNILRMEVSDVLTTETQLRVREEKAAYKF